MSVIYSTNEFNIHQDKRKSTIFTITTSNNDYLLNSSDLSNILFNSITKTKLIDKSSKIHNALFEHHSLEDELNDQESVFSPFETQEDVRQRNNNNYARYAENISLIFKAMTVESFTQFRERHYKINNSKNLQHNLILNISYSLSKQISYLLNDESKCFYKFDISKILVIDGCKFIYLSCEDLKDVKEKKIYIYSPISKSSSYLSPELKFAKSIPILVNYKTIFYSLGLLILDLYTSETPSCGALLNSNYETNCALERLKSITCIKETKLYYFLERCLLVEPEKRFLLYI
jgi:hypothetical protein